MGEHLTKSWSESPRPYEERPFLEAPAPPPLENLPWERPRDEREEEDDSPSVIIIDI